MSEQWVQLAPLADLPEGTVRRFRIDFRSGWVVNMSGRLKAYFDLCTHAGGSLKKEGPQFRCLRHGATFAISSGQPTSGPAIDCDPLQTVELKEENGIIYFKRVLSDD